MTTSKYIGKKIVAIDECRLSAIKTLTIEGGWEVCLHRGDWRIAVEFYLGEGHNGREPELKEVIYALLNDSQAGELSFEDFCGEFGYDTDSRRAYSTWEACKESREKLLAIFYPDEIAELEVEFSEY